MAAKRSKKKLFLMILIPLIVVIGIGAIQVVRGG